jgi:hypothetical protein
LGACEAGLISLFGLDDKLWISQADVDFAVFVILDCIAGNLSEAGVATVQGFNTQSVTATASTTNSITTCTYTGTGLVLLLACQPNNYNLRVFPIHVEECEVTVSCQLEHDYRKDIQHRGTSQIRGSCRLAQCPQSSESCCRWSGPNEYNKLAVRLGYILIMEMDVTAFSRCLRPSEECRFRFSYSSSSVSEVPSSSYPFPPCSKPKTKNRVCGSGYRKACWLSDREWPRRASSRLPGLVPCLYEGRSTETRCILQGPRVF